MHRKVRTPTNVRSVRCGTPSGIHSPAPWRERVRVLVRRSFAKEGGQVQEAPGTSPLLCQGYGVQVSPLWQEGSFRESSSEQSLVPGFVLFRTLGFRGDGGKHFDLFLENFQFALQK